MKRVASVRLYGFAALVAAIVFASAPASAQYKPRPLNDPATGEKFHIEAAARLWKPTTEIKVSSEAFGIPGDSIDVKKDLGLTDKSFPEVMLTLRPGQRHKFRLHYIPIKFEQGPVTLKRSLTFNGQLFNINVPVNSTLDWKAYRLAYEYDFIVKNRGFGGFIIEAKYTDVQVSLSSPFRSDFARARAPIPALGGIARVYVVPNISATVEITGFKLPASVDKRYGAHYADIDVYGTVNVNDYLGAQFGYRSFDVFYLVKSDTGSLTLKGLYFGGVVRY